MFFFGESTDLVVKYYLDKSKHLARPYPDAPLSEMTEKEARTAYIHSRIAYKLATKEKASQEILDALRDNILDHFRHVIAFSDDIAEGIEQKAIYPLAAKAEVYEKITREVRHPSSADNA